MEIYYKKTFYIEEYDFKTKSRKLVIPKITQESVFTGITSYLSDTICIEKGTAHTGRIFFDDATKLGFNNIKYILGFAYNFNEEGVLPEYQYRVTFEIEDGGASIMTTNSNLFFDNTIFNINEPCGFKLGTFAVTFDAGELNYLTPTEVAALIEEKLSEKDVSCVYNEWGVLVLDGTEDSISSPDGIKDVSKNLFGDATDPVDSKITGLSYNAHLLENLKLSYNVNSYASDTNIILRIFGNA